jgi:hypothetical protein
MNICGDAYIVVVESHRDVFFQGHVVGKDGMYALVGTPCGAPEFLHACCKGVEEHARYFRVVVRDNATGDRVEVENVCDGGSGEVLRLHTLHDPGEDGPSLVFEPTQVYVGEQARQLATRYSPRLVERRREDIVATCLGTLTLTSDSGT